MLNAEEKKELIEETKARRRRKRSGRTCSDAADQRNQNDKDSMQEEIYKSLVQNIPCAVYSAFPGEVGPTTFMSNKWKDWTGCSPEELYQYPQAWPRCIHPDDRERTVKAYAGACRDEVPYSLEYRIVHKDTGQVRYARDQGLLSKDKKNTVLRVDGIITDITEHKQAEKALRDSREWFRMMLENLPNVAVQGYGPDGTVHYWNKANESIYGYTAEEALGKDLVELIIPPEMRDYVREAIAHGARTGEMPPASELNLMHKDGSRVPVWSSHAVVRRAGREPELFCIDVDLCELKRTEEMLRQAHDELEVRVKGRTAELLQANEALQIQITERMKVEDALRQSEICYKSVVENTGEGIVVVQDGKLQFANSYVETALGHTREELMSRPFMEFVHPDDRDRVMNIHVRRFKGEEIPPVYELRGIDGHGDTRWLENNGILIEWNGRPATLNFLRDVTDRKKVEEALRKSEEQYRQLVDTSPHGIQEADVEGKIIFANSAFHRIYGYEDGELIGKSICDLPSTTQERDQIRQFIRHLVEDRPEPSPYFGRSLTKNGRTIDVQVDWNYVLDVDGNVEGFTSIITDITERKRSQETLHKSEIRHRELFNSMSSGVAVYNPLEDGADFVFEDLNQAGERISMVSKEDVVGRKVTEIFPAVGEFGLLDVFHRVNSTGKPEHHPVSLYEDDKLSAWYENYVYKLPSGEVVAVYDDVTEQKLVDQELEKQRYHLAKAQDMGRIGTWELDIEKNELVWTDENYRIFGLDIGTELTYETSLRCIHPDDREYVDEKWKAALNNEPYDIEHRLLVDGKVKWVREKADIQFDGKRCPVLAIGFTQDITESKRAEDALRDSEEKFRSLAEQSPNMIFINTKGGIVYANRKCEEVMGYKREEFYSPDFDLFTLIAPESVELIKENLALHLRGEEVEPYDYCLINRDGERIEAINTSKLIQYEGEMAILGIVTDITERKCTERKLIERGGQLKSLASQLSRTEERERHRLATTLHDQIGQSLVFSKLKLDELRTSEPSVELADALGEVCSSLDQVIQETRALTFDLSSPILYELGFEVAVAEWLTDEIREKHGIETEFDDDGRQKLLSDDIRAILFRNVRELLINVVKHAQARKVKVSIRGTDEYICVRVEDDGVGFDPAKVKAMATKSDKFGLFSIRERLEQLGGLIEIDSGPGRGSRILMKAPLKCETLTDEMEL